MECIGSNCIKSGNKYRQTPLWSINGVLGSLASEFYLDGRSLSHSAAFVYDSTENSRLLLPQGLRHIRLDGNCFGQVRIARIRRVDAGN